MYRSTSTLSSQTIWAPDNFTRQLVQAAPTEIWTFPQTARILYREPAPKGVQFSAGDVLTFNVISQQEYRGGQIYVWNPYDPAQADRLVPGNQSG